MQIDIREAEVQRRGKLLLRKLPNRIAPLRPVPHDLTTLFARVRRLRNRGVAVQVVCRNASTAEAFVAEAKHVIRAWEPLAWESEWSGARWCALELVDGSAPPSLVAAAAKAGVTWVSKAANAGEQANHVVSMRASQVLAGGPHGPVIALEPACDESEQAEWETAVWQLSDWPVRVIVRPFSVRSAAVAWAAWHQEPTRWQIQATVNSNGEARRVLATLRSFNVPASLRLPMAEARTASSLEDVPAWDLAPKAGWPPDVLRRP